ncbi:MAG: hypothetical protein LC793_13255 [Thermomicrobia bacterium]|nr:hypothetical protein [Thermomicrobia bacterium]MCA1722799.1 hypothetical protein [Thermomicrobia bacterium]
MKNKNKLGRWMKNFVADGSFNDYYGRILRGGGEGLPSATEARKDLERARQATEPRFPL